ncbi:hypothetical protein [Tateyamaria sp. SN6-1]|uniref:hypothetical protein n=1 Tax=Tateyamaria sp. SN6-1 TaxID=3092148 RepID=UPI0039F62518
MSRLPDPLVLHVIPARMRRTGWSSITLGVFLTGICAVVYLFGAFFPLFFGLFLVIGLLLTGLGLLNLGIARGRPVALRIDRHGMSGYYVPTLNWTDILRFGRTAPGSQTLAIELFDRAEVRRRQTSLMWRFNLRLPLGGNWHIVVPGEVLEHDLDRIVATAKRFHSAAMARDQGKTGM